MRRIWNSIKEDSFTGADIPEQFFVVTSIDYSLNKDEVKKGVLKNVSGISGAVNIVLNFMGVARDLIIAMDGPQLISLNNVSRIMYDNPHYLVSNNLEALFRIWSKDRSGKYGYEGVFQNLFNYMKVWMKKTGNARMDSDSNYADLFFRWDYGHTPYDEMGKAWGQKAGTIKNVNDFVKSFMRVLSSEESYNGKAEFESLSYKQVYDMVVGALEYVSQIYGDEAEWVLKKGELKIPQRSKFIIGIDALERFYKWKDDSLSHVEKMTTSEYRIKSWQNILDLHEIVNDKYEVAWLDMKEFKAARDAVLVSRADRDTQADMILKKVPDLRIYEGQDK